jgi:hypothetical protein
VLLHYYAHASSVKSDAGTGLFALNYDSLEAGVHRSCLIVASVYSQATVSVAVRGRALQQERESRSN